MRKKFKTCFILTAVVSMVGLFFCSKVISCPSGTSGRAIEEQTVKNHPEMAKQMQEHWDGKQQQVTRAIIRRPLRSNFWRKSMQLKMAEEKRVVKKEISNPTPILAPTPLRVQVANLKNSFEKIPFSNKEVENALRFSFYAQSAKITHEWCQEQEKDILEMVSEGILNKDAVVDRVQDIATDEYKAAVLWFFQSCSNPKIKFEIYKLQKLSNPIDVNGSIGFDPLSWQSKKHPVSVGYISPIALLDKFSTDVNNITKIEAVRIFKILVAETESSNSVSVTANLPTPTEDINTTITEPIESPATLSPIGKAD